MRRSGPLRRTTPKPRRARPSVEQGAVTSETWVTVVERDAIAIYESLDHRTLGLSFNAWLSRQTVICVAAWLGATGPCGGPQTVEHVKDALMMGKRAPGDVKHLVACCQNHNVGVPSKEVRELMREHLMRIES